MAAYPQPTAIQDYIDRFKAFEQRAEAAESRVRELEAANAELNRQLEQARKALALIEDQAGRAALVQDRSVAIIKSACRLIAREAHEAQS